MAVQEHSCIPVRFTAGDTVKVRLSWSAYPASLWNLSAVFNGPAAITGTVTKDGDDFILSIPSTGKPIGRYAWAIRATEISSSESETVETGSVAISADPFATQTPSAAAVLVSTLEDTIKKLAGKTLASASVNGKSYTFADIEKLNTLLRLARADFQNEIDAANDIAGRGRSSLIRIRA